MSIPNIRNALEGALANVVTIDLVHENQSYDPTADRPYAEVYLMVAKPGNPTMGDGFYQEIGVLQINLQYPPEVGTLAAAQQAELIRAAFKRGASFTDGGVAVIIDGTPEIGAGRIDSGAWMLPIKIPWHADIYA